MSFLKRFASRATTSLQKLATTPSFLKPGLAPFRKIPDIISRFSQPFPSSVSQKNELLGLHVQCENAFTKASSSIVMQQLLKTMPKIALNSIATHLDRCKPGAVAVALHYYPAQARTLVARAASMIEKMPINTLMVLARYCPEAHQVLFEHACALLDHMPYESIKQLLMMTPAEYLHQRYQDTVGLFSSWLLHTDHKDAMQWRKTLLTYALAHKDFSVDMRLLEYIDSSVLTHAQVAQLTERIAVNFDKVSKEVITVWVERASSVDLMCCADHIFAHQNTLPSELWYEKALLLTQHLCDGYFQRETPQARRAAEVYLGFVTPLSKYQRLTPTEADVMCRYRMIMRHARSLFAEHSHLRKLVQKVNELQRKYAHSHYVYVHAHAWSLDFAQEIYRALYGVVRKDFFPIHFMGSGLSLADERMLHRKFLKQGGDKNVLFMNASFFGNFGYNMGSSTLNYLVDDMSQSLPQNAVKACCDGMRKGFYEKYKRELSELEAWHADAGRGGKLWVIMIPREKHDSLVVSVLSGGRAKPVVIDGRYESKVNAIYDSICEAPQLIHGLESLEFCLLMTPSTGQNPDTGIITVPIRYIDEPKYKIFQHERNLLMEKIKADVAW